MRVQLFPIQGESTPRLELRWEGLLAHVYLDGVHAATLDGPKGLKSGWSHQLEDGTTLEIRAIRRVGVAELSVLRNGEHLPTSPSHPNRVLATSCNVLFALSGFLVVTGTLGILGKGWVDAVFGCLYLAGALLFRARRRLGAVVVAVPMIVSLDFLLLAAVGRQVDRSWFISLVLYLMFLWFVVRSYQAVRNSRALNVPAQSAG